MKYLLLMLCLLVQTALAAAPPTPASDPQPAPATQPVPMGWREIDRRLDLPMDGFKLDHVPAHQAFALWAHATGVDLVINWGQIQNDGLQPSLPVSLDAGDTPAGRVLRRLMDQFSPDTKMIAYRSNWCVEVMTRAEANHHRVVRSYDIADLLPSIRATVAMPTNLGFAGGSSGGASGGNLPVMASNPDDRQANADHIVQMIRKLIEPDVWVENGGESTISFFNGQLIVRAPLYVQVKIGQPSAVMSDDD